MQFAALHKLWWLLPLLILWSFCFWQKLRSEFSPHRAHFWQFTLEPHWQTLCGQAPALSKRRNWQLLRIGILLLLTLALLQPQQLLNHIKPARIQGIALMLVIDTSQSMQALDLDAHQPMNRRRTRLQVVQDVVSQFISQRPADALGTVIFGAEAFNQCPLTLDHQLLTKLLHDCEPGMVGDSTAIGSGLAVAVKRLRKTTSASKVIILLTDGSNNSGTIGPLKAAELAQQSHIKIYTIGAGTRGKAPFLVDSPFGPQIQYMDADLDEGILQKIATMTQGVYFRAEETQKLKHIYQLINKLEKSPQQRYQPPPMIELYSLPVFLAIGLWLLELWQVHLRWQRVP